jgi:putative transposase
MGGGMSPIDWIEDRGMTRFFRARMKMNAPGVISHITQRAAGADRVFHEDDDYLEMLGRLKGVSQAYYLEVLSFVLMPNHVHLLVRQTRPNLDEAMRELFSRYARRHNDKYERKGHLFGGPYRQAVCFDEGYVLAVSLYIHLNPVRATMATHPLAYRWSSCRLFCQSDSPESFLAYERILEWLSPDPHEAKRHYVKMLEKGMQIEAGEVLEDPEAIHRFQWRLAKVIQYLNRLVVFRKRRDEKEMTFPNGQSEMEEMMAAFVEGQVRSRPQSKEARRYMVEQLISRGYTREEIARRLGVSRKTIYNILNKSRRG